MKNTLFLTTLGATLISSSLFSSAAILWSPAAYISGADSDISTAGTLEYAYAINDSDATVNGVLFEAGGVTHNSGAQNFGSGNIGATTLVSFTAGGYNGGSAEPWNSLSSGYQGLLDGGIFINSSSSTDHVVTLGNLTDGQTYQVQVWFNDSRSGRDSRINNLKGSNTVGVDYTPVDTQGGLGQYALGTFVASGTSEDLVMGSTTTPQLNAIQVRAIPEPSSFLLSGLGLLLVFRRRR